MTDEQKKLFKATICAMLPYGLKGQVPIEVFNGNYDIYDGSAEYDNMDVDVELNGINVGNDEIDVTPLDDKLIDTMMDYSYTIWDFVPYLRPMSSLIGSELDECRATCKYRLFGLSLLDCATPKTIDYLISHHFDIHHLIEKGVAFVAPNGMYNP